MAIFLIWIILSVAVGGIGADKNIGFWGGFFVSLIASPLVGLIVVLFSKSKPEFAEEIQPAPPIANPISTQSETGVADELIKFKDLLDKGVITQEEFDLQKARLLK